MVGVLEAVHAVVARGGRRELPAHLPACLQGHPAHPLSWARGGVEYGGRGQPLKGAAAEAGLGLLETASPLTIHHTPLSMGERSAAYCWEVG